MATFKRRPTEIEAIQFDGTVASFNKIFALGPGIEYRYDGDGQAPFLVLPSFPGVARANIGDWVCQADDGKLGVCPDEMFQALYEPVED